MSLIKVNTDNFKTEVLDSDIPVLVDFWASWCGPCKMLSPIVDEIAGEADGFKVASLNVDESSDLAIRYRVSAIPTLLVFDKGEVVNRSVGFVPKPQILALLGK